MRAGDVTEVTVRANIFLLNHFSLSIRVVEDGHFGQLAHLSDLLTGLTPSVGPWLFVQLKGQRRRPERVPGCPGFFRSEWVPFSIRGLTSE